MQGTRRGLRMLEERAQKEGERNCWTPGKAGGMSETHVTSEGSLLKAHIPLLAVGMSEEKST